MIWLLVAAVVAVLMEPWAAFLHGSFWHASLWRVHRSHHESRVGRFERNDLLAVVHAPIAIALIVWGAPGGGILRDVAFGSGIGMTTFAVGYVVVHDGLVHGRLPVGFLLRSRHLRAIVRAHRVHHRTGAAPYGLFLGLRELRRASAARRRAAS